MSRAVFLYLDEAIESIDSIAGYVAGMSSDDFERQPMVQDAVIRRLVIIAEAVKQLPPDLTSQFPAIPWKEISAMRNILIHVYFGVKIGRVWRVIQNDLVPLRDTLNEMRNRCRGPSS